MLNKKKKLNGLKSQWIVTLLQLDFLKFPKKVREEIVNNMAQVLNNMRKSNPFVDT